MNPRCLGNMMLKLKVVGAVCAAQPNFGSRELVVARNRRRSSRKCAIIAHLCADFKVTINKHIDPRQHPIPNPNELFSRVAGGNVFSTLDLSQAYAQLPLSEASQKYCVIATHRGLYAFQRLPFGVASAPTIWQKTMDEILQGISGMVCFYDDVAGANQTEHEACLHKVLIRLAKYGVQLRREKCKMSVNLVR